jgi:hypothetical protein
MTATIRTSNFTGSELPIVQHSLGDVPTRVTSIVGRLRTIEQILQQRASSSAPPALQPQVNARDRRRLQRFGFDVHRAGGSSNLAAVIRCYTAALSILTDQGTTIDRLTPQIIARINATLARYRAGYRLRAAYVWGRAAVDLYNDGVSSAADLIYIGDAYFSPQPDDTVLSSVTACRGRTEVPLARVAVLTHEAIHWHNGTGGHSSMGALRNPENYQRFMIQTSCDRFAQATVSSDQRLALRSDQTSPGVPPMPDRLRKPGPFV